MIPDGPPPIRGVSLAGEPSLPGVAIVTLGGPSFQGVVGALFDKVGTANTDSEPPAPGVAVKNAGSPVKFMLIAMLSRGLCPGVENAPDARNAAFFSRFLA